VERGQPPPRQTRVSAVRSGFTHRTVLGLIAGSAAATVTGVTYTNTIAEQRADPHITVEGVWAHVKAQPGQPRRGGRRRSAR
jgi:hypothetical protein